MNIEKEELLDIVINEYPQIISEILLKKFKESIEIKVQKIIITDCPVSLKVDLIKYVKNVTGLGLKESKNLVDTTPFTLIEFPSKEQIEDIKSTLDAFHVTYILKY